MKILTLLLFYLLAFGCSSTDHIINERYLHSARKIASWLSNTRTDSPRDIWPDDATDPTVSSFSLSQGIAGKVIFCIELFNATKDSTYFRMARDGCDHLIQGLSQPDSIFTQKLWAFGPYGDLSGAYQALSIFGKQTADEECLDAARSYLSIIERNAQSYGDSISWGPNNDIMGGLAGIGLVYIDAFEKFGEANYRNMAESIARILTARSQKTEHGQYWYFAQDRPFNLPNFSHGAAGIGFFYARLYEATDNSEYLHNALSAVEFLNEVAVDTVGDAFLVPYGIPNEGWSSPYEIGWAHGPAGTARLFQQLFKVTGDKIWLDKMKACAAAIDLAPFGIANPIFGQSTVSVDRRFGLGGVVHFLLDMHALTSDEIYLTKAQGTLDYMLKQSIHDNQGMYWEVSKGDQRTIPTGYFYGSAGIGLLCLKMLATSSNKAHPHRLVDDVR
ncbi:MAG: lanthionine synthetase LanC family protein [Cyclobacteriaceae bacterium]